MRQRAWQSARHRARPRWRLPARPRALPRPPRRARRWRAVPLRQVQVHLALGMAHQQHALHGFARGATRGGAAHSGQNSSDLSQSRADWARRQARAPGARRGLAGLRALRTCVRAGTLRARVGRGGLARAGCSVAHRRGAYVRCCASDPPAGRERRQRARHVRSGHAVSCHGGVGARARARACVARGARD